MKIIKLFVLILITIFLFQNPKSITYCQEKNDEKYKKKFWTKQLKNYPLPGNAIELEWKYSFPNEDLELKGIFLNDPRRMSFDSSWNIYITDTKENRILKFDSYGNYLQQFGKEGQGPDDLLKPTQLLITEKFCIVSEMGNMRIQFMNKDGKYIKSFRIYKAYHSLAINDEGFIFAAPLLTGVNPNDTFLIDVLSQEGKLLYSFGKPLNFKYDFFIYNKVNLIVNKKGELIVAFYYLPIVRKYSQKGELLEEFRINNKVMKEKEKYNLKNLKLRAKGKRVSYKPIIRSLKVADDGFYILHTWPRIEILSFGNGGEQKSTYWNRGDYNYHASEFIIQNKNDEITFYVLQFSPEMKIDVFSQRHQNPNIRERR